MRYRAGLFIVFSLLVSTVTADPWHSSAFELKGWNAVVSFTQKTDNVFSPVGFALNVAVLGTGTGGSHRAKIAEALGLMTDFGAAFAPVIAFYNTASASNRVSVTVAPSLWVQTWQAMDRDFIRLIQRDFEAEVGRVAHGPFPANAWTDAKTEGRIPEILDKVSPNDEMLLLTGVAFEGAWETAFDPLRTKPGTFTRADGSKTQLPLMHQTLRLSVIKRPDCRIARLPFAEKDFSLIVILPENEGTFASLRSDVVKRGLLDEIASAFRSAFSTGISSELTALTLPRMEIVSRWELVKALSAFNVPLDGYSRIGAELKIGRVIQSAFFRVTEKGGSLEERLAAGSVAEKKEGPSGIAKETFSCDRPFLYFVFDERNGTVILAGQFTGIKPS